MASNQKEIHGLLPALTITLEWVFLDGLISPFISVWCWLGVLLPHFLVTCYVTIVRHAKEACYHFFVGFSSRGLLFLSVLGAFLSNKDLITDILHCSEWWHGSETSSIYQVSSCRLAALQSYQASEVDDVKERLFTVLLLVPHVPPGRGTDTAE